MSKDIDLDFSFFTANELPHRSDFVNTCLKELKAMPKNKRFVVLTCKTKQSAIEMSNRLRQAEKTKELPFVFHLRNKSLFLEKARRLNDNL